MDRQSYVSVHQGVFSVELGDVSNPFPLGLFETPLWIGMAVESDTEMIPRRPITSTAFSQKAQDANTLEGSSASSLDQSAHVTDNANPHNVTAVQVGAINSATFTGHSLDTAAHHVPYTDAEAVLAILTADGAGSTLDADTVDGLDSSTFGSATTVAANQIDISSLQTTVTARQVVIASMQLQTGALQGLLQHFSRSGNNIYVTGANLQIRSGSGATDGEENGLGNLIVGYDEARTVGNSTCSLGAYTTDMDCITNGGIWALSHKSGSHNVVVGAKHNYSRYGGLVVGGNSTISGVYSSVSGGRSNTASGNGSSVSGGQDNVAKAVISSITGGQLNNVTPLATAGVVSGGFQNTASGVAAAVGGGEQNEASGVSSAISGGNMNKATALYSSVSGGSNNNATSQLSSLSGGRDNFASGVASSISGGAGNSASAEGSSISGGFNNQASGLHSSISGGSGGSVTGTDDWRAGTLFEEKLSFLKS